MKKYHSDQHINFTDNISDTASVWAAKVKAGMISREDRVRMDDWLSENPAHKMTFDRMNTIWDEFSEFKDHPLVVNEMDKIRRKSWMPELGRFFGRVLPGTSFTKPFAVVVAIVIVVAFAWVIQVDDPSQTASGPMVYQSKTGEQKTVIFLDGSKAILDTKTTLAVHYSDSSRNAELIAGSALFSVVHDSDRPFIVVANNTQIQVLGTEFNVSLEKDHEVVVAVLQGHVQVSRRTVSDIKEIAQKDQPAKRHGKIETPVIKKRMVALNKTITAGQSMVVDEKNNVYLVKQVKSADIKKISAWRDGKLDFDRAPLEDVITQINRYVDKKIVIGDDALKTIQISVILKISDSGHFVASLEELFPIEAKLSLENEIILTERSLK